MNKKKESYPTPNRIALVISTMDCGGAQRIASIVANHWANTGILVTIITLADTASSSFFPLAPSVEMVNLGASHQSKSPLHGVAANFRRIAAIRNQLRACSPDVVVSFMDTTNVLTLLASRGLGIPVVVSERSNPGMHPIGTMWETLKRFAYPTANAVTVLTEAARNHFSPGLQKKIYVVPNPVSSPRLDTLSTSEDKPTLLAVGRLVSGKRFDLLMKAFAAVHGEYPAWQLTILGDGDQRAPLEALAQELGIADCTQLPGTISDPTPYYMNSDIFVLTSLYEGFPNVLLEAMACGLPAVSFDCPNGPKEILAKVPGGILVADGDVAALSKELAALMAAPERRKSLGETAKTVTKAYSPDAMMALWDMVLVQSLKR